MEMHQVSRHEETYAMHFVICTVSTHVNTVSIWHFMTNSEYLVEPGVFLWNPRKAESTNA